MKGLLSYICRMESSSKLSVYSGIAVFKKTQTVKMLPGISKVPLADTVQDFKPRSINATVKGEEVRLKSIEYRKRQKDNLARPATVVVKGTTCSGKFLDQDNAGVTLLSEDSQTIIKIFRPESVSVPAASSAHHNSIVGQFENPSERAVAVPVQLEFMLHGIKWWAEYFFKLEKDCLSGQLYLIFANESGLDFDDVALRAVAGDIFVGEFNRSHHRQQIMLQSNRSSSEQQQFELGVQTNIQFQAPSASALPNCSQKSILLRQFNRVGFKQKIRSRQNSFDRYTMKSSDVVLKIQNTEATGLGLQLPEGTAKVYRKNGPDFQFSGECRIKNVAPGFYFELFVAKAVNIYTRKAVQVEESKVGLLKLVSQRLCKVQLLVQNDSAEQVQFLLEIQMHNRSLKFDWKTEGLKANQLRKGLQVVELTLKPKSQRALKWEQLSQM